jgi:site-specific recombinase XerD
MARYGAEGHAPAPAPTPANGSGAAEVIVRDMMTPDRAFDDFLDDGLRRGWSERTISTYRRILRGFTDRLPLDYDISDVKEDDVRRYLGSMKGLSRGTIAHAEAVLSSAFKWCYLNRKIKANPMDRIQRTKRIPADELDVTHVSSEDVPKLLAAARALDALASTQTRRVWTHTICLMILVYMGPRRRAVSRLRRRDYDRKNGHMRFKEKGGKTIWKPVPDELRPVLDEAADSGVWAKATDFLVPPAPYAFYSKEVLDGKEDRDDRCIWEIVKACGRKAGVETHVHALRAAFAVYYLKSNPGDLEGLRALLGHRQLATTAIYLRFLEQEQAMDRVRGLSWEDAA